MRAVILHDRFEPQISYDPDKRGGKAASFDRLQQGTQDSARRREIPARHDLRHHAEEPVNRSVSRLRGVVFGSAARQRLPSCRPR